MELLTQRAMYWPPVVCLMRLTVKGKDQQLGYLNVTGNVMAAVITGSPIHNDWQCIGNCWCV
jgi:hypothetical protein